MITTTCKQCNKDIISPLGRQYCDQICRGKYHYINNPRPLKGHLGICEYCGKETISARKRRKYCDAVCTRHHYKILHPYVKKDKSVRPEYQELVDFYEKMEKQRYVEFDSKGNLMKDKNGRAIWYNFDASLMDILGELLYIAEKYTTSPLDSLPIGLQISHMWQKICGAYKVAKSGNKFRNERFCLRVKTECVVCGEPSVKLNSGKKYSKVCNSCRKKYFRKSKYVEI